MHRMHRGPLLHVASVSIYVLDSGELCRMSEPIEMLYTV